MSKEKAIELIKDSLLEIPDIDADKGYSALSCSMYSFYGWSYWLFNW